LVENRTALLLIQDWKATGRVNQEAFDWSKSRRNWIKNIEDECEYIENLPAKFGREYLRLISLDDQITPVQKFLTAMIWGYGDLGYGAYRVNKMFHSPNFKSIIESSYEIAKLGEPLKTYEFLAKNRISQLGPSFGTKWICFSSNSGNPSPIYDSFISMWIGQFAKQYFAKTPISAENWNTETYRKYYEFMYFHAEKQEIKMDDLEYIIFEDALKKFSKKSKWLVK